jgi:hypothetical protein
VYVTDGGHFENLGLVELLRQGCTRIFCFDASGGAPGDFTTLGQAIALADSELGVRIEIDPHKMLDPETKKFVSDHVVGTFAYDSGDKGTIVYARTAVIDEMPWDIRAYAERDHSFPNDPTYDQLYTDERFDAYRRLGAFTAARAIASMREASPQSGLASLRTYFDAVARSVFD